MIDDDSCEWEGYESGPFCPHWAQLADCDRVCARCGHPCPAHTEAVGCAGSYDAPCGCEGWVEKK